MHDWHDNNIGTSSMIVAPESEVTRCRSAQSVASAGGARMYYPQLSIVSSSMENPDSNETEECSCFVRVKYHEEIAECHYLHEKLKWSSCSNVFSCTRLVFGGYTVLAIVVYLKEHQLALESCIFSGLMNCVQSLG